MNIQISEVIKILTVVEAKKPASDLLAQTLYARNLVAISYICLSEKSNNKESFIEEKSKYVFGDAQ